VRVLDQDQRVAPLAALPLAHHRQLALVRLLVAGRPQVDQVGRADPLSD
jgi:hypothetical protein